jgi:hypothetical protein
MYKIDLFISYAHIDNQPVAADKSGWVTRFHASLDTLLSMRLGKTVRIWRDDKLQGNDKFDDEIVQQFRQTAVLVSVLTPRYLNSEWCTKEINEFCQHADATGGIFIDQKARVFKIVKTPVPTETSLPSVIQQILGYEFFTFEEGVPMELDDVYGEKYGQDFHRKVNKLAFEVAELLKTLKDNPQTDIPPSPETPGTAIEEAQDGKPNVYLAECSFDMKETRETLEAELRCLGYKVFPNQLLPREEAEYNTAVQSLLEQCALSIHLVGNHYGAVADGPSHKSVSVLQNELAAGICKQTGLRRLIWVADTIAPEQDNQRQFVDSIHNDAQAQQGADLITGTIEHLKSAINSTLAQIENTRPDRPNDADTTNDQESQVYLICAEQDRKSTVPLRKLLKENGFTVSMPAFKGDATEVRRINQQLLSSADVVIVFYGLGEEAWKRSVDTELKKLPGYIAGRPVPTTFTYLAEPHTCDKDDMVDMEEPNLINGMDGLSEQELADVISKNAINTPAS